MMKHILTLCIAVAFYLPGLGQDLELIDGLDLFYLYETEEFETGIFKGSVERGEAFEVLETSESGDAVKLKNEEGVEGWASAGYFKPTDDSHEEFFGFLDEFSASMFDNMTEGFSLERIEFPVKYFWYITGHEGYLSIDSADALPDSLATTMPVAENMKIKASYGKVSITAQDENMKGQLWAFKLINREWYLVEVCYYNRGR